MYQHTSSLSIRFVFFNEHNSGLLNLSPRNSNKFNSLLRLTIKPLNHCICKINSTTAKRMTFDSHQHMQKQNVTFDIIQFLNIYLATFQIELLLVFYFYMITISRRATCCSRLKSKMTSWQIRGYCNYLFRL